MQQFDLMSNSTLLESKLKKRKFLISTNVIRKGKKRVVRKFHKRKFTHKKHQQEKKSTVLMEKRTLSLFTRGKNPKRRIIIYVQSTHNNTIYTISRDGGKTICSVSTGMCGFKNTRKSTSYASQVTAEKIRITAKKYKNVFVKMRGLGPGKLSGVRALYQSGLEIKKIQECTCIPHNGCRPPKRRRL